MEFVGAPLPPPPTAVLLPEDGAAKSTPLAVDPWGVAAAVEAADGLGESFVGPG